MKKKQTIEVVVTTEMYYLVVNAEIVFQIIPSAQNLTILKSKAFEYCVHNGTCVAIAWVFEGSREQLEAKLKK